MRLFSIIFLIAAAACSAAPPTSQPSIVWDANTLHLVAENAWYGRMIRLRSGDFVCAFSRGPSVWSSRSVDSGKTWETAVHVGDFANGIATNSELRELADGRILYAFNERDTRREPSPHAPDNGIAIAFSDDAGKTWSPSRRIYGGEAMWEPVTFECGGELVILFADEKPYVKSDEQQISMMKSRDGGKTWTPPTAVSFRKGHRDGMPVPATLADGRVVMAIEDDGIGGLFKPVIVELAADAETVGGGSARRWSALAEPLPDDVYAGAPYLVTLGDRATVLSAQVAEPGGPRQMAVWVSDADAKNFGSRSTPFDRAGPAEQLWNALLTLDDHRVLAIGGTTIDGRFGVWTIEGDFVP